ALHRGDDLLGGEETAERVDPPGRLEVRRGRFLNAAPDAGAGVIDEDLDLPQITADRIERARDRACVGDVALVHARVGQGRCDLDGERGAASEQRNRV